MNKKTTIFCNSKITKKNGTVNGKRLYKCFICGRQFRGGVRLNSKDIWHSYTKGKQTYAQLAEQNCCSIKTIQRKIDLVKTHRKTTFPSIVNLLMDTTYFGKKFGVMVFKDSVTGQVLYKQYVKQETNKFRFYPSRSSAIIPNGFIF